MKNLQRHSLKRVSCVTVSLLVTQAGRWPTPPAPPSGDFEFSSEKCTSIKFLLRAPRALGLCVPAAVLACYYRGNAKTGTLLMSTLQNQKKQQVPSEMLPRPICYTQRSFCEPCIILLVSIWGPLRLLVLTGSAVPSELEIIPGPDLMLSWFSQPKCHGRHRRACMMQGTPRCLSFQLSPLSDNAIHPWPSAFHGLSLPQWLPRPLLTQPTTNHHDSHLLAQTLNSLALLCSVGLFQLKPNPTHEDRHIGVQSRIIHNNQKVGITQMSTSWWRINKTWPLQSPPSITPSPECPDPPSYHSLWGVSKSQPSPGLLVSLLMM